jgi:hypothetical protein
MDFLTALLFTSYAKSIVVTPYAWVLLSYEVTKVRIRDISLGYD